MLFNNWMPAYRLILHLSNKQLMGRNAQLEETWMGLLIVENFQEGNCPAGMSGANCQVGTMFADKNVWVREVIGWMSAGSCCGTLVNRETNRQTDSFWPVILLAQPDEQKTPLAQYFNFNWECQCPTIHWFSTTYTSTGISSTLCHCSNNLRIARDFPVYQVIGHNVNNSTLASIYHNT